MLADISEVIEGIAEYLGEYFLQEDIDPELFGVYSVVSAGYLYVKMDLKYPQSKCLMDNEHSIFSQKHIIARISENEILYLYDQDRLNDFLYDHVEPNLPRCRTSSTISEKPYIILNSIKYYPDRWSDLRDSIKKLSTPNTILTATWPPPPIPLSPYTYGIDPFPFRDDDFFQSRLKNGPDFSSLEDRTFNVKMFKDRAGPKSLYYANSKKYQEQIEYPLIAPFIFDEYNALNVKEEEEISRFIETVPRP